MAIFHTFKFPGVGWGDSEGQRILSADLLLPKVFRKMGGGGGGGGVRLFWVCAVKGRNTVIGYILLPFPRVLQFWHREFRSQTTELINVERFTAKQNSQSNSPNLKEEIIFLLTLYAAGG